MDRTISHAAARIGRARRRHAALLAGCALGLVLAATPHAAFAQDANKGFQSALPSIDAGSAVVFNGSPGSKFTGIDVGAAQTVITWTPDDTATSGAIDFLPNGYTAAFSSSTLGDYTVLNRILPGGTATIGINGNITSSVSNGDGQSAGGNVWFYTPNGFVVGPNAVIQVGGLVMTTNDITYSIDGVTGNANFLDANGAINFRGPGGSAGSIVNNGSIIGNNPGSYVALIAPRVVQSGYVSADRSIAYVAAEQVDLTINAGNFDIVVGQGTTDANGIVHDGTTTGAASAGFFDQKAIQFVAVPKNTALTMLLSGNVGYTPASFVYDDGASVTLTAGAAGSPDGNIEIGEADFSSGIDAHATGDLTVAPPSPGPSAEGTANTIFQSYATLSGDKSVHVTAAAGTLIDARNGLSVYSDHQGGTSVDGTTGLDGRAGTITLSAEGGQINAAYLGLGANGQGGGGSQSGGDGFGGTIDISASFGGSITAGYTYINAQGDGGPSFNNSDGPSTGGAGGTGHGGTITLADSGGDATVDPTGGLLALGYYVSIDASAVGGNPAVFGSGLGGDAFGGTVKIAFDRQNQSMGSFNVRARAADGDGALDPVGGTIDMNVGGGIVVTLDDLLLDTGVLASTNGPAGSFGTGGTIDLTIDGGAALNVLGQTELLSEAELSNFFFSTADTSPDLTGGTVNLTVDGGSFTTRGLGIDVSAYNVGAITSAGFAHGGTATVTAANGGTIQIQGDVCTECFSGNFEIDAEGYGTSGLSPNLVTGGDITLSAQSGGTISADSGTIYLFAGTSYGSTQTSQGTGVTAQGGTVKIDAIGGTIATGIYTDVSGQGGDGDDAGGSGTGGTIAVRVLTGGTIENPLYAFAYGSGGFANVAGDGGDGTGGRLTLTSDASATFTNFGLNFYANGQGGATSLGTGGDGYGGSAQIDVIGGTHNWSDLYLSGYGQGSSGFGNGSLAGSAFGSQDGLNVHVGGGAALTLGYLGLDARAAAGADGNDNAAIGGTASLLVDQLASLTADSIGINASAMLAFEERSFSSFDTTPDARGGSASAIANTGTITTPFLEVVANGMTGGALTTAGTAIGGTATVGASIGGSIDIIDGFQGEVLTEAAFSQFSGLVVQAQGLGAEGPSAAHATGGTATLYTAGGAISSVSDIIVNADASAGSFAGAFAFSGIPASGFDATGGTASVEMRTGGSGGGAIDAPTLTINARGLPNGDNFSFPPVQGNGGVGTGGTATLEVAQGALDTGNIIVNADGIGGSSAENSAGGAAFASGSGAGGSATVAISGGSVDTTDISVSAQGIGASGQGQTQGATPSLAAAGTGGTAQFIASGGTLNDSGSVSVQAVGFGGEGAFNPNGGPGGNGGDAFGGTALFSAPAGGTASIGIAGDIRVDASAFGGEGSGSVTEEQGNGGNATGGGASMALADIPFTFGSVQVNAFAAPGAGAVTGGGTGGSAAFSLVDSASAAATPRTIDSLDLNAASYAGAGAASVGGSTAFTAQVGNAGSALSITNGLSLYAYGETGPAGYGFTGAISGAPVTVGGDVSIITPRDAILTISGAGALDAGGELDISVGRTFTASGLISAAGNAFVSAGGGITMTDLAVGGSTFLESFGPVVVSHDLRSTGPVTVSGQSVSIFSLGGLTFADADATGGDLEIETAGDLLLATADATGAVTLTSNGGSIHNTGAVNGGGIFYTAAGDVTSDTALSSGGALSVDAGGTFSAPSVSAVDSVSLSADLGMALASVVSGDTTLLQADNGSVTVDSLISSRAVKARAESITISGPFILGFAEATATNGDLSLTAAGNLSVAQGGATGAVTLTSTNGFVGSTGTVTAGGDVSVSGDAGIAIVGLTSGGTSGLTSLNGEVSIANLNSAGPVTALGQTINLGSSGALTFADLDATAGDILVQTAGSLTVDTVDAAGSITLTSTGGALNANGALNGDAVTLRALANLQLATGLSTPGAISLTSTSGSVSAAGPVAAGGNLAVSGNSGISLGAASSGGTTSLTAANGAIAVSNLASAGPVTASGRSIDIASSGALTFANAQATAGDLKLATAGNLSVAQGSASGTLSLTSTGGTVASTGTLASGGNATVAGGTGVALASLASGGATSLTSTNGSVVVNSLTTTGSVTASGRSVVITSPGALTFADAQATAGNLNLTTAGNLSLAQGGATGTFQLTSTGGTVSGTGLLASGGNAIVSGQAGVVLAALTSGGTTSLASANGAVSVTNLNSAGAVTASGLTVDIGSSGALTFADLDATAGNAAVRTAGNLTVGTADATGSVTLISTGGSLQTDGAINANGITLSSLTSLQTSGLATAGAINLTSTSGSVSASGPLAAGGNLAVSGNSGVTLGTATSGGTTTLTAANGTIGVTDLRSTGAVTASGRSVTIGSTGALTFADLDATAGNIAVQTAGSLALGTVDATGSVTLASTGGTLQTNGAINANSIALSSLTNLQTTGLATAGAISLTSTSGSIGATGPVSAGGNVSASGQTGVSFGTLTSGGTTALSAPNGAIGVTALTSTGAVTATGRSVDLRSPGSLTVSNADATAGNLALQAAQGLTVANASASGTATMSAGGDLRANGLVNAASAQLNGANVIIGGQVRATGDLGVRANQLFTVSGLAAGRTITVDAGDIAIGATGRIGSRGLTQSITLRNLTSTSPMNIGGTGQQGQFSLDKSEAARLFADQQISFVSRGSEGVGGDVRIGELALAFGDQANIGSGGLLKVDAGGLVEVNGAVTLTTVSNDDGFSIDPTRINVIAGSGSIVMRNAGGALQGVLELEAGTIAVADQSTLDAIGSLSDFAAISSALDTPGPAGPEGGYLQAGTINLIAGDAVYIQNGGATTEYDDRRGFRANALNIETESSSPQIAINGVISTLMGDLFGLETASAVSINGAFAVDLPHGADVTINGCAATGCGGVSEISFIAPSSAELELVVTTADEGADGPTGQLVQVEENQPLITPPMVDEPITGVGNDDLWQVKCVPDGAKSGCPTEGGKE